MPMTPPPTPPKELKLEIPEKKRAKIKLIRDLLKPVCSLLNQPGAMQEARSSLKQPGESCKRPLKQLLGEVG